MKKTLRVWLLSLTACLMFSVQAQQLAFPGAEGFGRHALGARAVTNPSVYHVTNLNDSGSGSLRDAVSQPGRIVVFDVSGVIKITSRLTFAKNLTIAGQTAPGDGIIVYGNGASFTGADNVIVRYLRIFMGKSGDSGKDALGIANGQNMIFDHCSVHWGLDENFSISWDGKGTEPSNITIQNCMIGQGIETHSCGGLIQTDGGVSILNSMYIDNKTRNPKVKGLNQFINNVVYNWGSGGGYILGDSSSKSWAWLEGNYFVAGPNAGSGAFTRANTNFSLYHKDNMLDTNRDGNLNGAVALNSNYGSANFVSALSGSDQAGYTLTGVSGQPKPFPSISNILTAENALQKIISECGASLPVRTDVDSYLINQLESYGTIGKTITNENKNNIYNNVGVISVGNKALDSDGDGIPDAWEDANGLNKNDNSDAVKLATNGYLNIENYINAISAPTAEYLRAAANLKMQNRTTNSITIAWQNRTEADQILIQRSEDGNNFTDLATINGTATSYTDNNLPEEKFYTYRVIAKKNGLSNSTPSAPVQIQVMGTPRLPYLSSTPSPAVDATSRFYTQFTFSWENITGPWAGDVTYDLYFGTEESQLVKVASNLTESTYVYTPVTPAEINSNCYWRVDAKNNLGTTTGTVWKFRAGSYSFTTTFRDLGKDFMGTNGSGAAVNSQSGVAMSSTNSYTIGDEFKISTGGGATMNTNTNNGVYVSSGSFPFMYVTSDNSNYIEGTLLDVSESKNISYVYVNGTTSDVGEGAYAGIVYSDCLPFNSKSIIGFDEFFVPACRKGENATVLPAAVGAKSFRIYRRVAVMPVADSDEIFEISSSPAAQALGGGGNLRIAYVGATLELLSNDDPNAKSKVNTIESAKINGKNAIINTSTKVISVELPFGTTVGSFSVEYVLTDSKSSADFTSGNNFDFSNGNMKLTVTAENGDTRVYTLRVTVASGIDVVDLGKDWSGSSGVTATSGVTISGTSNTVFPMSAKEVKFTGGGDASIDASSNNVYGSKAGTFNCYYLKSSTAYTEVSLTANSASKVMTSLKLNGTSADLNNGSTNAILYSNKVPFDPNSIIAYAETSLPKCRGGNANGFQVSSLPVGTKSFRIYRDVKLSQDGSLYKIDSEGSISVGKQEHMRLAYIKVSLEAGTPEISSFEVNGVKAVIDNEVKSISMELPYGSNISSLTPIVTLGGSATDYSPKETQDFTKGAVTYTITDGSENIPYLVNIAVNSSPDDNTNIASLRINGRAAVIDNENGTATANFPYNVATLGNWVVDFELESTVASSTFTKGSSYDFTQGTLQMTITAQNGDEKVFTVTPEISQKKGVAILTADGKAASYDTKFLSAFEDYNVTLLNAAGTAPTDYNAYYADYDLIVFHANVGGTNAIAMGSRAMIGVKPILNMKAYFYGGGRWDLATPASIPTDAIGRKNSNVDATLQNHAIFKNIVFDGDKLELYAEAPTVANSFQYISAFGGTNWTTGMAAANHTLSTIDGTGSFIHELNLNNAAKYLMIGLSNEADSYAKFNDNTVTMLKNAANYLTNPNAYYDYDANAPSGKEQVKESKLVYFNGNVFNPMNETVTIFDQVGNVCKVSDEATIDVSNLSAGFYFAKGQTEALKFIKVD